MNFPSKCITFNIDVIDGPHCDYEFKDLGLTSLPTAVLLDCYVCENTWIPSVHNPSYWSY